jgi:hypothetical protein
MATPRRKPAKRRRGRRTILQRVKAYCRRKPYRSRKSSDMPF